MNATFRRGEALTRLENYAHVIVEHLALVVWYSDSPAKNHWDIELDALIDTNEDRDYVLIGIESHGVKAPEQPNWEQLIKSFSSFAKQVLAPQRAWEKERGAQSKIATPTLKKCFLRVSNPTQTKFV